MTLTKQARSFLDAVAEQNLPPWQDLPPTASRERFNSYTDLFGDGPELATVSDHTIPGNIRVRLYQSQSSRPAPAVVYFHGGGWVIGNIDTHDSLCRRLARFSDCHVISVDYSLSPEVKFPTALNECFAATQHVIDHASDFGIIADRVAVAGDSAGGNLAAAVALKSLRQGEPLIRLQVLIYPVIARAFDTESYLQFAEDHGLSRATMQWFWQQYMGDQAVTDLASPELAGSLEGLPAAHVVTAEYDVLRDEGEAYSARLQSANVPTTSRRYDGNLHGFVHFAGIFDDGIAATRDVAEVLKSHLHSW